VSFVDDFLADLGNRAGGRGKRFAQRYWSDIPGFFRDVLAAPLHPHQADAGRILTESHRLALHGPHALGKTFLTAGCILQFSLTREAGCVDWKLVSTASANRQLRHYLWPEVHRLLRRVRWNLVGIDPWVRGEQALDLELKGYYGRAFGAATEHEGMIEGAHATETAFYFDESKHIKARVFDAAEGALAQAGVGGRQAYALAVSTPGDPEGRFFDICSKKEGFEDWKVRHVTKEEAIAAGQISESWAKARARQWGTKSSIYLNRVEGLFATSAGRRKVIPLEDVERAIERGYEFLDSISPETAKDQPNELPYVDRWKLEEVRRRVPSMTALGVDVGKGGPGRDPAALARRHKHVILPIEILPPDEDPEAQLVGRVQAIVNANGGVAVVDAIGAGGIVSWLKALGVKCIPFVASAAATGTDKTGEIRFANARTEMWWKFRELLHDPACETILPDDDTLTRELTEPEYLDRPGARVLVEGKSEIGKRLSGAEDREDEGGSTNRADAVLQSYHLEVEAQEEFGHAEVERYRSGAAL